MNNLSNGENVVVTAVFTLKSKLGSFILSGVLAVIALVMFWGSTTAVAAARGFEAVMGIVFILFAVIVTLVAIIKVKSRSLVVTDKRVIGRYGSLDIDFPLKQINETMADRKLLGYGTVYITTSSGGGYAFTGVVNYAEIRTAINECKEAAERSNAEYIVREAKANTDRQIENANANTEYMVNAITDAIKAGKKED